MTDPDNLIARLNAEIVRHCCDGSVVTERVLGEARDMILTFFKERDAAEAAHFTLGYNE